MYAQKIGKPNNLKVFGRASKAEFSTDPACESIRFFIIIIMIFFSSCADSIGDRKKFKRTNRFYPSSYTIQHKQTAHRGKQAKLLNQFKH